MKACAHAAMGLASILIVGLAIDSCRTNVSGRSPLEHPIRAFAPREDIPLQPATQPTASASSAPPQSDAPIPAAYKPTRCTVSTTPENVVVMNNASPVSEPTPRLASILQALDQSSAEIASCCHVLPPRISEQEIRVSITAAIDHSGTIDPATVTSPLKADSHAFENCIRARLAEIHVAPSPARRASRFTHVLSVKLTGGL